MGIGRARKSLYDFNDRGCSSARRHRHLHSRPRQADSHRPVSPVEGPHRGGVPALSPPEAASLAGDKGASFDVVFRCSRGRAFREAFWMRSTAKVTTVRGRREGTLPASLKEPARRLPASTLIAQEPRNSARCRSRNPSGARLHMPISELSYPLEGMSRLERSPLRSGVPSIS